MIDKILLTIALLFLVNYLLAQSESDTCYFDKQNDAYLNKLNNEPCVGCSEFSKNWEIRGEETGDTIHVKKCFSYGGKTIQYFIQYDSASSRYVTNSKAEEIVDYYFELEERGAYTVMINKSGNSPYDRIEELKLKLGDDEFKLYFHDKYMYIERNDLLRQKGIVYSKYRYDGKLSEIGYLNPDSANYVQKVFSNDGGMHYYSRSTLTMGKDGQGRPRSYTNPDTIKYFSDNEPKIEIYKKDELTYFIKIYTQDKVVEALVKHVETFVKPHYFVSGKLYNKDGNFIRDLGRESYIVYLNDVWGNITN